MSGKIELAGLREAFSPLPAGITDAEIQGERRDVVSVTASDGEISGMGSSSVTTLYARVLGEGSGTACTQDLGQDLKALLETARENGRWTGGAKLPFQPKEKMFQGSASDHREPVSPGALRRLALQLEKAVRLSSREILSAQVTVSGETLRSRLVSAGGADIDSENHALTAEIRAEAGWDGFDCGTEFAVTADTLKGFPPEKIAAEALERLRLQQRPGSFTPGVYRVLLDQPVVWDLMLTAWQVFSGPRCQSGASCFAGKLGQKAGSGCLSITDYPSYPGAGYAYAFDFEGSPCRTVKLLENGVMTGMLHHLDSGKAAGVPSNGRAGRAPLLTSGIPNSYTVTPRIVMIEPGRTPKAELPALLGDGLRITASYDPFHCLDITSGHFSIPCRGILYKEGRPVENVSSIAIHGDLESLFRSVAAVGDDLGLAPFLMTHAYCVGAPSLLVEKMNVSGK